MPAVIRQLPFFKRLGVRFGVFIFRLLILTLRVKMDDKTRAFFAQQPRRSLCLIWHNRLALALSAFIRVGKGIPLTGLVSASGDGAVLAEVMHAFGIRTVRGSSSRRAVEAAKELLTEMAAGRNAVITPDGPRGPLYQVKEGTAEIGRAHAQAVYVVGLNCQNVWQLK